MITFWPLPSSEIKMSFPHFFHEEAQFLTIHHKQREIGVYGVKTITPEVCEIEVYIYPSFRSKIPLKSLLFSCLDFPFTLEFKNLRVKEILISTSLQKLQRVLHRLEGVHFLFETPPKAWFLRKR